MTAQPIEALEPRKLLAFAPIQFGGKGYQSGYETAVDAQGNTIVSGLFQQKVDFDPGAGTKILTAVGETDIFIAKYDPNGALLWAGQIGGIEGEIEEDLPIDPGRAGVFVNRVGIQPDFMGEHVNGVATDASGNIFLAGTFFHTADFDPGAGVFELTANDFDDLYDAFLIKIDANGALTWAKSFGGLFNDVINGVAVDPQGNPVVTGYFTRFADFDPGPAVFQADALGRDDIFVAKYTGAAGKFVWVDVIGGEQTDISDRDAGNGIDIDDAGNIYITGTFGDEADFDPGPSEFFLEAVDLTDSFLLALSPRGKRVFAKSFGGEDYDGGVKIVVQGDAIYTAGYFRDELTLTIGKTAVTLVSAGEDRHTDLLVSKFSLSGSLIWAKQMGGEEYETIGGFGVDADGSVYTTGGFSNAADFDPGPGQTILTSIQGDDDFEDNNDGSRDFSYDIYISRLSTNGKFLNASRIGSSGDDFGAGLAINPTGGLFLTGQFRNTVPFNTAAGTDKLKAQNVQDGFLIGLDETLDLLG